MDIHRCRFVPYPPSPINAVAFSHPWVKQSKQPPSGRLAVGRANGDIEIWNPLSGAWHQELIIRGGKDRSVDGLVWVNEPDQDLGNGRTLLGKSRLFSIGYTSTVTEWDLVTGKPKRHASGQHGDIWCIAAQPMGVLEPATTNGDAASEVQSPNKLVAGTIDGELVMYSIEDDDLRFQRVLVRSPTKKAQMVSITFQSRKVVIVGCSDSTIRAYDIVKGQMIRRMTLGSDLVGGSKDIIVWSVKCLPGGNIVSGDSTGQICIWDGKTYTQSQRIQSHKSDVLSITTSADGNSIVSGGMDRRTILYKPTSTGSPRWAKVWGRRYHEHDVKCMATFEYGRTSVVVTGGPDSKIVVVPLKEMGRENHRNLSSLPQHPPLTSASDARLVVSWWEREVHIWILRKPAAELLDEASETEFDLNKNRKLLKTIVIKGDSNIASAAVNAAGSLLVVSTATDVKAFRLEHDNPTIPSDVKISAVILPEAFTKLGASRVQISPSGQWLLVVQDGSRLLIVDLEAGGNSPEAFTCDGQRLRRLRRNIPQYTRNGGLGAYDRTITQVAFSADSKMVATADLAGYIDTWILPAKGEQVSDEARLADEDDASESGSSDEDDDGALESGKRWVRNPSARLLPKLHSSPVVLSFSEDVPQPKSRSRNREQNGHAADDYTLLTITTSWQLLAFHPLQGVLTPWSRRHIREKLPIPAQKLLDNPKGVLWQGTRTWIYGVSFLFMIDMSQDLPVTASPDDTMAQEGKRGIKRKRKGKTTGAGSEMAHGNLQPHLVRKHTGEEEWQDIDMEDAPQREDDDSDDEQPGAGGELTALRNGGSGENGETETKGTERKSWWISYKYRPIFGLVQLGVSDSALEVALVERPTWDVEHPQSYFAGEPWER